jgi:hypothetical protein
MPASGSTARRAFTSVRRAARAAALIRLAAMAGWPQPRTPAADEHLSGRNRPQLDGDVGRAQHAAGPQRL